MTAYEQYKNIYEKVHKLKYKVVGLHSHTEADYFTREQFVRVIHGACARSLLTHWILLIKDE